MKTQHKFITYFLVITGLFASCKKLVEVPTPVTNISQENVFKNDATAIAVLNGLYIHMNQYSFGSSEDIGGSSFYGGLLADELTLYSGAFNSVTSAYYQNALSANPSSGGAGSGLWFWSYNNIFTCNSAIEGLSSSNTLTPAIKTQLLGEAKFLRALYYFYLVNYYGDVPLVLNTDYKLNSTLARAPVPTVYKQIITDLKDAQNLLSTNYLDGTLLNSSQDRVRPNKWVATALLARVYLYTSDWENAQIQSTLLINNASYALSSLNNTFLKASTDNLEPIWQLQSVSTGNTNTQDAVAFIITSTGLNTVQQVYVSNDLVNAFEAGDQRMQKWLDTISLSGTLYHFPYKYKVNTENAPVTEFVTVFRLAEQFLIRAESEANGATGGTTASIADINVLRKRAGLTDYSGLSDQSTVLSAIQHERQVELFTEFGHRWLDLKRTKKIDAIMQNVTPKKGGIWKSYQQLFPVPVTDILADKNLTQNPGY